MITKDQLAHSMLRDCAIIEHLYGKLDPGAADYRPSPGQRSTTELLRYLAVCGIAPIRCMTGGGWSTWAEHSAHVAELDFAGFPAAHARQVEELRAWFGQADEAQLAAWVALPWGEELPLAAAILEAPAKWLSSYKLQLFLYAKACGADIGTPNCWAGRDAAPA